MFCVTIHSVSPSVSGETIAKIYNLGLSDVPDARPLHAETVWDAFYLHALLLHASRQSEILVVPHHGPNADRLNDAIESRNKAMVGIGQPQWAHTCDDCEKVFGPDEDNPDAPWGMDDYLSLSHLIQY